MRLHYVSWGRDDAPAVVMLHGLRSYAQTWADAAHALTDRYRVVALDQRGRGASDWDPRREYYAAAYVRDLDALVRALGLRRFVLVGHSMGGANAFVYAGRDPERLAGLVIEDMGPGASIGSQGSARIKRELLETPTGSRRGPTRARSGAASGRTCRRRRSIPASRIRCGSTRPDASSGGTTPRESRPRGSPRHPSNWSTCGR